jgi:hypothetical protein
MGCDRQDTLPRCGVHGSDPLELSPGRARSGDRSPSRHRATRRHRGLARRRRHGDPRWRRHGDPRWRRPWATMRMRSWMRWRARSRPVSKGYLLAEGEGLPGDDPGHQGVGGLDRRVADPDRVDHPRRTSSTRARPRGREPLRSGLNPHRPLRRRRVGGGPTQLRLPPARHPAPLHHRLRSCHRAAHRHARGDRGLLPRDPRSNGREIPTAAWASRTTSVRCEPDGLFLGPHPASSDLAVHGRRHLRGRVMTGAPARGRTMAMTPGSPSR